MPDRSLVVPKKSLQDASSLLQAVAAIADEAPEAAAALIRSIDEPGFRTYWIEGGMEWKRRHRPAAHTYDANASRPPRSVPAATLRVVATRDAWHCRYCGLRTVSKSALKAFNSRFPDTFPLGRRDADRHAAALVLGFSPDHVVPWHRGGTNDVDNLVTSCGMCNYMKGSCTIEELDLTDPRKIPSANDDWDGLAYFR